MPLSKLQFKPGVNREITAYSNEGGWFDIDNVRFQKGYPEKIGGWQKRSSNSFLGTCRALHPWVSLNRAQYVGVGTHLKYYIDEGGVYNDSGTVKAQSNVWGTDHTVPYTFNFGEFTLKEILHWRN